MQARKAAGVALAVGAWALGLWFASSTPHSVRSARDAGVVEKSALPQDAAVVRIARAVEAGTQEITLDAALVRRAVRDGELHFVLDDGSTYPVRIERNYTDATGHWNIVGRADTKLGEQPMVLTVGRDAVFGVVPLPNGRMLRVTSGRKGVVSIALAAGIVPAAAKPEDIGRDVVFPPEPTQSTQVPSVIASAHAHLQTSADLAIPLNGVAVAAADAFAGLPPQPTDTAPVTIKLLALYGADMVTLRGSDSAARTEIANLVALTNQAHIDSGSIVRFDAVVQAADVTPAEANQTLLFNTAARYENARNAAGADLVSIVRAHVANDPTCGVAFTPNFSLQRRGGLTSSFGYSVVSIDDNPDRGCGPLVMPHELGHNLGAMHDRATDQPQDNQYRVTHGSYWFSSGYRTNEFADIMAYPEYRPWVPFFSSPRIAHCAGKPCGVEDSEDNVRTFNLAAAYIAAFRGKFGTVSVGDSEAVEPTFAPTSHTVEVRLTGPAPAGGLGVQITPAGGTAIEGVDYTLPNASAFIFPGSNVATFTVNVLPDAHVEETEFALFNVSALPGFDVAIDDAQARFDIIDRDARREHQQVRLWFPPNMAAPTQPIRVDLTGVDGPFTQLQAVLQPPDYTFAIDVPHGAQVQITPEWPDPFAMLPFAIEEARGPRDWNLYPQKGIRISGTLRAAPGMVMPPTPFYLNSYMTSQLSEIRSMRIVDLIEINGPDYSFSKRYPPNSNLILSYDEPTPTPGNSVRFGELLSYDWLPTADVHHDFVLSDKPSLAAFERTYAPWDIGPGAPVVLSSPAPPGGVSYRCRFEDGTAKAGVDYTVQSEVVSVPEGRQGFSYCGSSLRVVRNDSKRTVGVMYVVIDQVVGANLTTSRAPIKIRTSYLQPRTGAPGMAEPAN